MNITELLNKLGHDNTNIDVNLDIHEVKGKVFLTLWLHDRETRKVIEKITVNRSNLNSISNTTSKDFLSGYTRYNINDREIVSS